jgi:hypothetical protein
MKATICLFSGMSNINTVNTLRYRNEFKATILLKRNETLRNTLLRQLMHFSQMCLYLCIMRCALRIES